MFCGLFFSSRKCNAHHVRSNVRHIHRLRCDVWNVCVNPFRRDAILTHFYRMDQRSLFKKYIRRVRRGAQSGIPEWICSSMYTEWGVMVLGFVYSHRSETWCSSYEYAPVEWDGRIVILLYASVKRVRSSSFVVCICLVKRVCICVSMYMCMYHSVANSENMAVHRLAGKVTYQDKNSVCKTWLVGCIERKQRRNDTWCLAPIFCDLFWSLDDNRTSKVLQVCRV